MTRLLKFMASLAAIALLVSSSVAAQDSPSAEKRIALVIGNADYQTGALNTPANDAA
jgi:hypothetical protein